MVLRIASSSMKDPSFNAPAQKKVYSSQCSGTLEQNPIYFVKGIHECRFGIKSEISSSSDTSRFVEPWLRYKLHSQPALALQRLAQLPSRSCTMRGPGTGFFRHGSWVGGQEYSRVAWGIMGLVVIESGLGFPGCICGVTIHPRN